MFNWIVSILGILAAIILIGGKRPWLMALVAIAIFGAMYGPVAAGRVQSWNVFHYWLNSKWFAQLGYFDLYSCAIQVEDEVAGFPIWFGGGVKRDLNTYQFIPRDQLENCPRRLFTNEQWAEFGNDLEWLRGRPADNDLLWYLVMLDKGLNVTPTWLALSERLAQVQPGSWQFWLFLYGDFLGLLVALLVVWRVYGLERAALLAIFITTWFGTFNQIMGHWWQYEWLGLTLIGLAAWKKGWPVPAGICLAVATAMRIFPGMILVPMLIDETKEGQKFWVTVAITGLVAIAVGCTTSHGLMAWPEFFDKMLIHSDYLQTEPMNVGLLNLLNTISNYQTSQTEFYIFHNGIGETIFHYSAIPLCIGGVVAILVGFILSRRRCRPVETGLALTYAGLNLSRYYYQLIGLLLLDGGPLMQTIVFSISLVYAITSGFEPLIGNIILGVMLIVFMVGLALRDVPHD